MPRTIKTTKTDWNNDGVTDYVNQQETTTNKAGQVTRDIYRSDGDNNGTWEYISQTDNTYNKAGLITKALYRNQYDADKAWDDVTTTTYKYSKGNLTEQKTTSDYGNDKDIDNVQTTKNGYDKAGHLVETLNLYDWNGDGVTDTQDRLTYVYAGDQLIQELSDIGNNGTVDATTDYVYV